MPHPKILFIIDAFAGLNPKKDTTMALMRAAINYNYDVFICEMNDISMQNNIINIKSQRIILGPQKEKNKSLIPQSSQSLLATDFHSIFMRKDPPIEDTYIYCTYLLSFAKKQGVRIVNSPSALRDFNEKLLSFYFPDFIPPYCLSACEGELRAFADQYEKIILKPIDGMGGMGVFLTDSQDLNFSVIAETLTKYGTQMILAQKFIPDISTGDKRILILHGKPFEYALARLPAKGNIRGNLAAGGKYEIRPLSDNDWKIALAVAPFLKEHDIALCGIDVIGDYLTEVNITSPTCLVQLSELSGFDIADDFIKRL